MRSTTCVKEPSQRRNRIPLSLLALLLGVILFSQGCVTDDLQKKGYAATWYSSAATNAGEVVGGIVIAPFTIVTIPPALVWTILGGNSEYFTPMMIPAFIEIGGIEGGGDCCGYLPMRAHYAFNRFGGSLKA